MQRRSLLSAGVALAALPISAAHAAPRLADPLRAVLSPDNATLFVQETLPVETVGGTPAVRILLPENAADFQLVASNGVIERISRKVVAGEESGELAREKARMEKERASLKGELAQCEARVNYASEHPDKPADFPALYVRIEEIKKRIAQLEALVKSYPRIPTNRLLVTAALSGAGTSATVRYSYRIPDCSWSPVYQIDCAPQKDGKGILTVRLEALVTQSSGMDWTQTTVELITRSGGPVNPSALRGWQVGNELSDAVPRAVGARSMKAAAPLAAEMAESAPARNAKPRPVVVADTEGTYASWTPTLKGLLQGESRILLAQEKWTEPLVWLARPLNRDARVFLTAEHELAPDRVWPDGHADLSVDGVAIGGSSFSPRSGKVFLSFGEDPRVKLTALTEPRKSGVIGFIGKDKVWEWAWRYTVSNNRPNAVNVRVERPLPKSVNKEVLAEVTSVPEAKQKDNALLWEFPLPPKKSQVISHSVKVTAPEKLDIYTPTAP